ncbi:hypothetical protein [Mucilaginibacter sp. L3T2-6]|uniref:hypothetical protein n=1 Tax=Mucilaginibacter sp. L3T2-6 TaxID=3062491 RepID=UPI002675924F|nr:hypothetical protein [Mucilaginibacter sp. L3T2-6]MDO3645269.1 hypothetical protein [Mucilaginibacter sp. L3T2-6]MDV6217721.1 hypothetical protein [Mucilaginibacter sp. L3T2-6]
MNHSNGSRGCLIKQKIQNLDIIVESMGAKPPIIEQLKEYVETIGRRLKYQAIDESSGIIAEMVIALIMIVLILITFILFNITLALIFGHWLGSTWKGFVVITAFYALSVVLARLLRESLQDQLIRLFIKKVFSKIKS